MAKLSLSQLIDLARRNGFPNPELAAAVAMAESNGNTTVIHDTIGRTDLPPGIRHERSIGLWQINLLAHPGYASWDLTDPDTNAHAAFQVSWSGTHWSPWSTYTTKDPKLSYKRYYNPALPSEKTPLERELERLVPPRVVPVANVAIFAVSVLVLAAAAGLAVQLERERWR